MSFAASLHFVMHEERLLMRREIDDKASIQRGHFSACQWTPIWCVIFARPFRQHAIDGVESQAGPRLHVCLRAYWFCIRTIVTVWRLGACGSIRYISFHVAFRYFSKIKIHNLIMSTTLTFTFNAYAVDFTAAGQPEKSELYVPLSQWHWPIVNIQNTPLSTDCWWNMHSLELNLPQFLGIIH